MRKTDTHSQQKLIRACLAGDRQAQHQLYHQYAKAMLNTAYRIVHNQEEAEDILQDAFLAAFRSLHGFRAESNLGAWLKRIVVNHAINTLKKQKLLCIDIEEAMEDLAIIENGQSENYLALEVAQAQQALLQLPTGYRTIFSLYILEGYDHAEIAEILGISVSTSISQLSRAKQKIRGILAKMNNHGPTRTMV